MAIGLVLALGVAVETKATNLALPGVNLGATSFEDGGGGLGTLLQWSTSRFDATRNYNADGDRITTRYDKSVWIHRLHYAYTANIPVARGYAGAEVIVPLMDINLQSGPAHGHSEGIANPNVGLYVQWLDKRLFGYRFESRLSLILALPWGNYRPDATLNLGTHYTSFNPYYAFTLRPDQRWEISGRLMYLWNGPSRDPEMRVTAQFGAPVHSIRPGQAFHYNLSASYALTPHWRLGLGMYQLQQISADRINGQAQARTHERIFGLGPGVQWRKAQHRLIGNLYFEGLAENRAAGTQAVMRYMYVF
ncbi:SphA family protein [Dyella caseinilytica]|uniref:Transporter n=1 Tax=Dyella caseinilytica TaxID=1849581 RepID=A0ABX7GRV0_9GAMM|nr:transporter [Dyella caseinilytica]QRN53164.1 transporter [Dyella caseinilytica]